MTGNDTNGRPKNHLSVIHRITRGLACSRHSAFEIIAPSNASVPEWFGTSIARPLAGSGRVTPEPVD